MSYTMREYLVRRDLIGSVAYATSANAPAGDLLADFQGCNGIRTTYRGYDAAKRSVDLERNIDSNVYGCQRVHLLIIDAMIDENGGANQLAEYARNSGGMFYILGLRDTNNRTCPRLNPTVFNGIINSRDLSEAKKYLETHISGLFPGKKEVNYHDHRR